MKEAYRLTRAPGIDGVTADDYVWTSSLNTLQ
jgi:hypothetical protein